MTENQRLKFLRLHLKISQGEFAKSVGLQQGSYSDVEREKSTLSYSLLKNIATIYNVNADWIITGEGEMLKDQPKKPGNDDNAAYRSETGIPLIPVAAVAGNGAINDYSIDLATVEERYVVPLFKDVRVDFMIRMKGNSMYPKYNSGDVLACRFVKDRLFIQWNKPHLIDTKSQGPLVKRIKKSLADAHIVLKSDNKDYDEFDMPIEDINTLALIVGVIRLE